MEGSPNRKKDFGGGIDEMSPPRPELNLSASLIVTGFQASPRAFEKGYSPMRNGGEKVKSIHSVKTVFTKE